VFNSVNYRTIAADGGPAGRVADVADVRFDNRATVEIHTHKFYAVIDLGRLPSHVDFIAGMDAGAGKRDRPFNGLLLLEHDRLVAHPPCQWQVTPRNAAITFIAAWLSLAALN